MNIQEFRQITQMSQKELALFSGIPLGTIRNWEQGISKPPDYVLNMLINTLRRDKMINVETLKLFNTINKLAELSKNGICDFKNATCQTFDTMVFYDCAKDNEYRVVCDACIIEDVGCEHHDAVSYYDSGDNEFEIRVVIEDDEPCILIKFIMSDDQIAIHDGKWYFC